MFDDEAEEKRHQENIKRRIRKQAKLLPDLPSSASFLAQQLHERAQDMLKIRIENIEVTVSKIFDEAVTKIVNELLRDNLRDMIAKIVRARVELLVPAEVARLIPEVLIDSSTPDWIKNDARSRLNSLIQQRASELLKDIAPTEAEKLVKAALGEIQRCYGSAAMLSTGGDPE